jgi:trk system potassium uptake protein TrkH
MGMVIFGVAILPLLGVGGMGLYKAEAPGPTKDKMTPRIAETAKLLWVIYLGLSLLAGGLFYLQGMTAFDAVNHAMTGIATGGFSTHDLSLGYYDSASIRLVATGAMLVAGTSFAVLHRALTGELSWSEQPELRAYVGILCLATAVLTLNLWIQMPEQFPSLLAALGDAAFQAVSILTGTGYASADFDSWPPISHAVLFVLFFSGGMAGSTSGGVKVLRVMLLWRVAMLQFFKLAHRRGVAVVRLGAHTLDDRILLSSLGFIVMWLALLAVGTLALAAGGADPLTSLSAAAVSLANIGPGFGEVGPSRTFATLGSGSKLVLEALMILGRLEIYTVLVVLTPRFWRY